jgi:hypothetical protein
MPDSQSLIQSLLASTTKVTSTLTENALDLLKYQQSQLQKQLLKQELLNANLYQSLLDSGILSGNNEAAFKLASNQITSTATNILDVLKNKGYLNNNHNNHNNRVDLSSPIERLQTFLPLGEIYAGFSGIFERLFGSKFWLYALLAIVTGTFFTCIACFCMYCLCCSRFGNGLMCFLNCSWLKWLKKRVTFSASASKKKKELKSSVSDSNNKFKCCI